MAVFVALFCVISYERSIEVKRSSKKKKLLKFILPIII